MFQVPEIPNIDSRLTLVPGNILALCELAHLILNFIMLKSVQHVGKQEYLRLPELESIRLTRLRKPKNVT